MSIKSSHFYPPNGRNAQQQPVAHLLYFFNQYSVCLWVDTSLKTIQSHGVWKVFNSNNLNWNSFRTDRHQKDDDQNQSQHIRQKPQITRFSRKCKPRKRVRGKTNHFSKIDRRIGNQHINQGTFLSLSLSEQFVFIIISQFGWISRESHKLVRVVRRHMLRERENEFNSS